MIKKKTRITTFVALAFIAVAALTLGFAVRGNVKLTAADSSAPVTGTSETEITGEATLPSFVMRNSASIRSEEPKGIRFETEISAEDLNKLPANAQFGTLIVPASVLGENALDLDNADALDVVAQKWRLSSSETVKIFSGVLIGTDENDFPADYYGDGITARAYVKYTDSASQEYVVYAENTVTRSMAFVAGTALLNGEIESADFLKDIVDTAIGDGTLGIESETTAMNTGDTLTLSYTGNKGIPAILTSDNECISVNGNEITAVSAGSATVTATFGRKTAAKTFTVSDVYTVTLATGERFTLTGDGSVNSGADYSFTCVKTAAYASDEYKLYVMVNGEIVSPADGDTYTVYAVDGNLDITATVATVEERFYTATAWGGGTVAEGTDELTLTGTTLSLSSDWVKDALDAGYTHLKFDISGTDAWAWIASAQSYTVYSKLLSPVNTARVDLTELLSDGTYYDLLLTNRSASAPTRDDVEATITVDNAKFLRSAETVAFTKSDSRIYCAYEENGFLVLDTTACPANSFVTATEEWSKYHTSNPDPNVKTCRMYFYSEWLNRASNPEHFLMGYDAVSSTTTAPATVVYAKGTLVTNGIHIYDISEVSDTGRVSIGTANEGIVSIFDSVMSRVINTFNVDFTLNAENDFTIVCTNFTSAEVNPFWYVTCMQRMKYLGYTSVRITVENSGTAEGRIAPWGHTVALFGGYTTIGAGETKVFDDISLDDTRLGDSLGLGFYKAPSTILSVHVEFLK